MAFVLIVSQDSVEFCRESICDSSTLMLGWDAGDIGRGFMSVIVGRFAVMVGDKGSNSGCSWMFTTIFLNADGVRCFSWPLLRLSAESSSSGDDCSSGVVAGESSL